MVLKVQEVVEPRSAVNELLVGGTGRKDGNSNVGRESNSTEIRGGRESSSKGGEGKDAFRKARNKGITGVTRYGRK